MAQFIRTYKCDPNKQNCAIVTASPFFQYGYYKPYKDLIRNKWMRKPSEWRHSDLSNLEIVPGENDIVVHLRLGDIKVEKIYIQ